MLLLLLISTYSYAESTDTDAGAVADDSSAGAGAEASADPAPTLMIYVESPEEISQALRRIVGEGLAIQLEFYGLPTEICYLDPGESAPTPGGVGTTGLVATVSGDSSNLVVDATYQNADGTAQATRSYQGPVDLRLDRSLGRLIDGIVDDVDSLMPAPEEFGSPAADGDSEADGVVVNNNDAAVVPSAGDSDAVEEVPRVLSPSYSPGLRIGAAFSSLIPIGDASRYFDTLVGPAVFFGWSFCDSLITIGLSTGASFARAAGVSVVTDSVIVPLVFDFRLAFGSYPLEAGLRVAGGVAMLSLDVPQLGSPTFFVPTVDGGLTTQIYLGEVVGITVDLAFLLYIEESITIMGFRPQIGVMFTL